MPSSVKRVECTGITEDHIGIVWKDAAPLLEKALGEGETMDQVLAALFQNRAQLWIGADEDTLHVACVTEVVRRGGRLLCNVWLTGGRGVNNWLYFLDTIEEWAAEQGCDAMLIDRARTGWKRLLPKYQIKTISLEKEIRNGR